MKASLFNAHGKGGLGVETSSAGQKEAIFWSSKRHKSLIQELREPRSVLDHRSPSPQTSTSTLSAPLCGAEGCCCGGGGSSDAIGVAAVSDKPNPPKWSLSDSTNGCSGGGGGGVGVTRKEEWISEAQPIPAGLNMPFAGGGEKCGGGLGLEDWEAMLSDVSAGVSQAQEQSFLGWIMGDTDDPSRTEMRQQHQQLFLPQVPAELDGNYGGLGIGVLDPTSGLEPFGSISGASTTAATFISHPLASDLSSGCGFPLMSGDSRISPPAVSPKSVTFGDQADNSPFSVLMPVNSLLPPLNMAQGELFQGTMEDKSQFFGQSLGKQPPLMLNSAPNPALFVPMLDSQQQQQFPHLFLPSQSMFDQLAKFPIPDSGGGAGNLDLFLRRHQPFLQQKSLPHAYHLLQRLTKPKVAVFGDEVAVAATVVQQQQQQQQHQALLDQLFQAAKMIESENSLGAHEILARLNQQLPSPLGQPLLRTAFYFKEALLLILASDPGSPLSSSQVDQQRSLSSVSTPFDVVLKLTAYKAFSEVSPLLQFANFTCIQAILEELCGCSRIHIVDFDIGFGGRWSSFMQELAQRRSKAAGSFPLLKITAFVSPLSYHHLELQLTKDNLSHFARDLNIPFEFNIISLDSFDPSELVQVKGEAIAVNLPVGTAQNLPFPTLLRLVKILSPKIVVSVDQGCDRSDLPFSNYFLHAFQSSMVFLDSIDATVTSRDVASKIEQFLVQPRIKNSVLGRHRVNEQMLPWHTLFASAGFKPIQFSNFTETQAECLLKRVQVRGFHVEKHQASLSLCWQRGELISVSAWRC